MLLPLLLPILPRGELLVEGNSLRSTSRITGTHLTTILKLMFRFGEDCRSFLDESMRNLTLREIQCDEIWTFVGKKQARRSVLAAQAPSPARLGQPRLQNWMVRADCPLVHRWFRRLS